MSRKVCPFQFPVSALGLTASALAALSTLHVGVFAGCCLRALRKKAQLPTPPSPTLFVWFPCGTHLLCQPCLVSLCARVLSLPHARATIAGCSPKLLVWGFADLPRVMMMGPVLCFAVQRGAGARWPSMKPTWCGTPVKQSG